MATITVATDGTVDAPADRVYGYLADMREHHPRFLPPAFSRFKVESGGTGAGTIVRFTLTAGRRSRDYRMTVAEPEPGRVLTESDSNASLVTTFTVTPRGASSHVRVSSSCRGAGGVGGLFERRFAPRVGVQPHPVSSLDWWLRHQPASKEARMKQPPQVLHLDESARSQP